jgi:hypothetical protein
MVVIPFPSFVIATDSKGSFFRCSAADQSHNTQGSLIEQWKKESQAPKIMNNRIGDHDV